MLKSRCWSTLRGSHGLSARRARRTKSRGPKGLHLEVGALRAPRLLVHNKDSFNTLFIVPYRCVLNPSQQQLELIVLRSDTKYLAINVGLTWYKVRVKHHKNCECCPCHSLFKGHCECWDCSFQLSEMQSVSQRSQVSRIVLWGCSSIVVVFVFVIVFLLVRSCFLITLIKSVEGHKSLGALFEDDF